MKHIEPSFIADYSPRSRRNSISFSIENFLAKQGDDFQPYEYDSMNTSPLRPHFMPLGAPEQQLYNR